MKLTRIINRFTLLTGGFCMLLGFSLPVYSAPGTITNIPLFLSNKAEPNIFFMTDDSGSMDLETLTPTLAAGWGGVYRAVAGSTIGDYFYLFGADGSGSGATTLGNTYVNSWILPTQAEMDANYIPATQTPEMRGVWRGRNGEYNTMYYNPARIYTPWAGVNNAGAAYTDITNEHAAPLDPYISGGTTVDLAPAVDWTVSTVDIDGATNISFPLYPAMYWAWEDTNTNQVIDPDDAHTLIKITPATLKCLNGVNATKAEQVAGAGCMLRDYADEIKNFSNWFSYHRKREYVSKYALSQVINNSNKVRMGLAVINNDTAEQIRLASMNTDPATGNKRALLDRIYTINSTGGTPLRQALQRAGNYYQCSGTVPNFSGAGSNCGVETAIVAPATQAPGVCQQNFTVLISDGERNGGSPGVGNVDNGASSFTGTYYPLGVPVTQNFSFGGEPYADGETNTLADVAMRYYERDLHGGLENRVPIICGVDENPAQHMVTFTVGFGVSGDLDLTTLPPHPRRGYAPNCTATTGADYPWYAGTTINTSEERIDDMVHAAFNGRGEYLSAQDPEAFSQTLNDTIRAISNRTGAAAAVTFNSSSLSSNTRVFIANFNSTQWSGELAAYPLNPDGTIGVTPDWLANAKLDARDLTSTVTDRAIVTFDRAAGTGIPFRWANLTTAQKDDLRTDSAGALEPISGTSYPVSEARLDFIRGERACEIGDPGICAVAKTFRPRASRLGDLIHSAPVFVGTPRANYPDSAPYPATETYTKFKLGDATASNSFQSGLNAATRTDVVYIGGNDGMLHAIEADTGEEIWAYVPHAVFATGTTDGMHKLTESGYEHHYYVDQTPTVVDAYVDIDSTGGDDWHTVLVGGLRGGGRGIFALDVTDPDYIKNAADAATKETRMASNALWEFTSTDDIDMGYTFSQPAIVALGNATSIEWYVIFGNGYNSTNTATGSNPYSSKLFILKLEGPGVDGVWDLGTDYFKLDTRLPAGTSVAEADRNGMSSAAVADYDTDGVADRVYVGDLYGRVWAIDVAGTNPSSWDFSFKSGSTPRPFFTATDGDAGAGNRQPITSKPILAFHPTIPTVTSGAGKNTPNLMVYFGTGQYLASGDLATTGKQTFYGVWDKDVGQRTVNRTTPGASSNHLLSQPIITTFEGIGFRTIDSSATVDYAGGKFGWYIDLPTSGERVVFNPQVRANIVFFNTLIPSQNPCDFGGSGWIMAVDQANGTSPIDAIVDTNNDGVVDGTDVLGTFAAAGQLSGNSIPTESAFLGGGGGGGGGGCPAGTSKTYQYVTLSDGTQKLVEVCLPDGLKLGRLSWRQLKFNN